MEKSEFAQALDKYTYDDTTDDEKAIARWGALWGLRQAAEIAKSFHGPDCNYDGCGVAEAIEEEIKQLEQSK